MRILHTSDWHIGKRLLGRERIGEQEKVLGEIARICEEEKTDVVLVAGDVFDTYLPSAEAEDLFYGMIKKIAGEDRAVIVISGNHDDNVRLSAATALCEPQGIYIYGNYGYVPRTGGKRKIRVSDAGPSHLVLEKEGEKVYFNLLPYPNEARLKESKDPNENFYDKMSRWIAAGQAANTQNLPSVFVSHLFVAGGKVSEGERSIDLGGARAVPLSLLPHADYVALGHLHRRQHFKNNVYYSGSVLQYAFDEAGAEKSVVMFDLDGEGARDIRLIPLREGMRLVRLQAAGVEAAEELLKGYADCYIELTVYLTEPLTTAQVKSLKDANAGLVSIIPEIGGEGTSFLAEARKERSPAELFSEFYKSRFGEEPSDELRELFLSVTEEAHET